MQLEIHDEAGQPVRRVETGRLRPGINRVHWDLREEASNTPRLRTSPVEHAHVELAPQEWRPLGEGGRVTLRARVLSAEVEIEVEDTGVGIAESDHELIFEEFRQAGDGWAQSQEGTGLGLALTKRLAELHGGSIRVASALGRGSTFVLRLPARFEAPEGESA